MLRRCDECRIALNELADSFVDTLPYVVLQLHLERFDIVDDLLGRGSADQ